jgi:hypothetical protein
MYQKHVENDAQQLKGGQREGTWGFEKFRGSLLRFIALFITSFSKLTPPPLP